MKTQKQIEKANYKRQLHNEAKVYAAHKKEQEEAFKRDLAADRAAMQTRFNAMDRDTQCGWESDCMDSLD